MGGDRVRAAALYRYTVYGLKYGTKMRTTIRSFITASVTLGVTGSITNAHAWQTRYYREGWIAQCVKSSTQEDCNAVWDNLIGRNDKLGMICRLGSKGETMDCDREK